MCCILALFLWQFCSHLVQSQLGHTAAVLSNLLPVSPIH